MHFQSQFDILTDFRLNLKMLIIKFFPTHWYSLFWDFIFFQVCLCTSFPMRHSTICHMTDVTSDANMAATVAPEHFNNLQLLLKVTINIIGN